MSKELKRVPLDFSWPIERLWPGYINPYYEQQVTCPVCLEEEGSPSYGYQYAPGYSRYGRLLVALWYGHLHEVAAYALTRRVFDDDLTEFAEMILASGKGWNRQLDEDDVAVLLANDGLHDFTHRFVWNDPEDHHKGWHREPTGVVPTAAQVNEWSLTGLGHGSTNQMVCVEARCIRYGAVLECGGCNGTGLVPNAELEAKIEAWTPSEPPTGTGYQLWSTTTSGHPVGPVFETFDALCAWAAEHAHTFASHTATKEAWAHMLTDGMVHHKDERGNIFL